jgi:O-antigen ligase/polysaccharide polymerase Wzy-like membrane protein
MSASAVTTPWAPAGHPARPRAMPPAVPVAAAALLGAAVATRSPALIVLALAPLAVAAIARPTGAVLVFAAGFYLNLPVLVARDMHLSSAVSLAFALLLLLPFLAYVVVGRRPLVATPALALMVGYLVVLVLSAIIGAGGEPSTVGPIVTFLGEGLLLYVLVSNVVRTPGQLRAVMWTLILAGAFMGLVSVWQELTHAYHTTLGGLAQVDQTGFDVQTPLAGVELRPRLAGPIGEKNRYAQILLVLVPLAVSRVRAERELWLRLLAAACAGLILSGVLLTFSRGAAVALVLLFIAMAVLRELTLRQAAALAVVLVAVVTVAAPDYIARVQSLAAVDSALSTGSGADGAIVGRATENLAALYVFRDHPALGVGPGQFFRHYSAIYGNALDLRYLKTNRRAHNLYLEIAADTGALGLAAFLAIVGVTMAQLWRLTVFWRRRDPGLASLSRAFLLALVAYLATGIFLQLAYERYFWFLLALANATVWMLRREAARAERAGG